MVQQYMTILCQVHELNPFDENIQNGIRLTRERNHFVVEHTLTTDP